MSKPRDDDPPDTTPVSNALDQELGRALDRQEARRLEERLLTDDQLRSAAARKTVAPDSGRAPVALRAEGWVRANSVRVSDSGKNLFGGTVRGLPGQPRRLDADGSAPASWKATPSADAQPEHSEKLVGTSISPSAAPSNTAKPLRTRRSNAKPIANKPRSGRFLFLGALLVVVPLTILLISRAVNPKPLFRDATASAGAAAPASLAVSASSPWSSGDLAMVPQRAYDDVTSAPAEPTSATTTAPTISNPAPNSPNRNTTAARAPITGQPTSPATAPTAPTAAPTITTNTGVEPFFKRTQP